MFIYYLKDWIIAWCNSRDLIGLAAMVYESLYHSGGITAVKIVVWLFLQSEISKI